MASNDVATLAPVVRSLPAMGMKIARPWQIQAHGDTLKANAVVHSKGSDDTGTVAVTDEAGTVQAILRVRRTSAGLFVVLYAPDKTGSFAQIAQIGK